VPASAFKAFVIFGSATIAREMYDGDMTLSPEPVPATTSRIRVIRNSRVVVRAWKILKPVVIGGTRERMPLPLLRVVTATVLAAFLAISKAMAEPGVIVINDDDKTHEYLVMSDLQVITRPPEAWEMWTPGFLSLAEKAKSPGLVYLDREGGELCFCGSGQVAFVTNLTVQAVLALSSQDADRMLAANTPMSAKEFVQKVLTKRPTIYPAVPVQASPFVCQIFLKTRPSDVILCKAYNQTFVIEIVRVADSGKALQVKVHRRPQDARSPAGG
jgi:hypothetical protein